MVHKIASGLFIVLTILVMALYMYHTIWGNSSYVKLLFKKTKDGIIRGALTGYLSGGFIGALHDAAYWGIINSTMEGVNKHILQSTNLT